ncbi:hypothetical protein K2224_12350 [Streptomyces sp. BHT-5-2]|uniref:hypothetical protein n=1 Tax=unclassified Streptomyces TaxID=2593676 RepID=UPI001C8EEBB6|nr:hypothetical protein [Streptomyces sp. BHT-5-2]QZL03889.1 hypothetical protein K2224_12350 [Streptomyces sp. BHT-5-2]
MIFDRINLTRRVLAALCAALDLAREDADHAGISEVSAVREKVAKDLGEVVRNAFNNGGITEAEAKFAMRPIYSTANEVHHGGV